MGKYALLPFAEGTHFLVQKMLTDACDEDDRIS